MSLEKQLADYGRLHEDLFGPFSVEEITDPTVGDSDSVTPRLKMRRPALILAAIVAVLLPIGGMSVWMDRADDSAVLDPPTTESITWSDVSKDQLGSLARGPLPLPSVVSNGDVYLASDRSDDDYEERQTWTSTDGITWEQAENGLLPVSGLSGGFLAYRGHFDVPPVQFLRSDDGRTWTAATPSTDPTRLASITWSGLSVDEVLRLRLARLPSSHVHEAGTVFKVGSRFVTYYWNSVETVEAAVSSDGETWEPVDVPEFLAEWLDFSSPRALSDRDISQRLWSGTFSAGHGKVLAVTSDSEGHHLWESTDGITWNEISATLPAALRSHPATSKEFRDLAGAAPSIYGSHRLTAMDSGWTLAPWHYPFAPEGSGTYHSLDGMIWNQLSPEAATASQAVVHTAGNKVFFFSSDQGLQIATINPES
jgi:hypothetical protein